MENSKNREKVIARAWKDPAFKKKLLQSPREALSEMGIKIPENVKINVIEDKSGTYTFVLPAMPTDTTSDAELQKIAGGCAPPGTEGQYPGTLG